MNVIHHIRITIGTAHMEYAFILAHGSDPLSHLVIQYDPFQVTR